MRPKLPGIVKFCILPFCVLFLSVAFFVPAFLGASKQAPTGEATSDYQGFLPIILNQDENLDAQATPTISSTLTSSPPPIPTSPSPLPSVTPSPTPTSTPPLVPPLPTPGITPSRTPSQTPTNTPTFTPSATSVPCPVQFVGDVYEGRDFVFITGDIGTTVTITDLSTGNILGSDILQPQEGHACPGYTDFTSSPLNEPLTAHHVLMVSSSDTTVDITIVLAHQPTSIPTATYTAIPTHTATSTSKPTATPNTPYIILNPDCGQGPTVQVTILGFNWDIDEDVVLFWNGGVITLIDAGHGGFFSVTRNISVINGTYPVRAESVANGVEKDIDTKIFTVPCGNIVIPTATPTPTSTPVPADLVIGKPQLISTPPIVAHAPLQFSVNITNYGQVAVGQQFFVDIFLDPQNVHTDHIPLAESSGYHAVDSLGGGQSKQLTITAPFGFNNSPDSHMVYAMVDSVQQIDELIETNNISSSSVVPEDTEPPTATPTPDGTEQISGTVFLYTGELIPQHRAIVKLIDPTLGVIAVEETDINGFYAFNNIPPLTAPNSYTIIACFLSDSTTYSGIRTGIQAPNSVTNIIMLSRPCTH